MTGEWLQKTMTSWWTKSPDARTGCLAPVHPRRTRESDLSCLLCYVCSTKNPDQKDCLDIPEGNVKYLENCIAPKNQSCRLQTQWIDFELSEGSFAMREKGGNRLVPGSDYMVDALKLPNQAPRDSGESLQMSVAWCCPDRTQHLFCWPILAISGQYLVSNGPVVDSRDLNLLFGHAEATPNK
ncbi:uncharacterized protein TNCV_1310941 [Trichonephila clavipes]|nr:uncharacterized protein TNCV_1310941 [Trichonephila clavipes]